MCRLRVRVPSINSSRVRWFDSNTLNQRRTGVSMLSVLNSSLMKACEFAGLSGPPKFTLSLRSMGVVAGMRPCRYRYASSWSLLAELCRRQLPIANCFADAVVCTKAHKSRTPFRSTRFFRSPMLSVELPAMFRH
jgi:hypothetical protein